MRVLIGLFLALTLMSNTPEQNVDSIAEQYVRLVLSMGQQDADYVDAYYGPEEWKIQAEKQKLSVQDIRNQADTLLKQIAKQSMPEDEMEQLRHDYLKHQLEALRVFADMKLGLKLSFDEESKALYDAVSPDFKEDHFAKLTQQLDASLPGKGSIQERYAAFRSEFIIPPDRLDRVFQLALAEARKRTQQYIPLPKDESFVIEYVRNKPWSGYNWYKGNYKSLIQINIDLPSHIESAIDLAGHEGYPGHHVYNVLLEQEMLRKRKWVEFSVYPLFSSQSFIAEGSANYGVEILFSKGEREKFEREVLFPAAGLNAERVQEYYNVAGIVSKLNYAGNVAAKHYLDGNWDEKKTVDWLVKYGLYSPDRAKKRMDFIRKYRSYVINYNLGKDLVAKYIQGRSKTEQERWKELAKLLGSPRLPSGLN